MVLKGKLNDLPIKMQPGLCTQYAAKDARGKKLLYICLQETLHGLMRAAFLFYCKFCGKVKAYGFVVNDYNPCVANYATSTGKIPHNCLKC